jgi:chorismate mutase
VSVACQDPLVEALREEIVMLDQELVETVNKRLRVVARLWRHKREQGMALASPEREEWLLRELSSSNEGPLSDAGLAGLHAFVLGLTKEELADG